MAELKANPDESVVGRRDDIRKESDYMYSMRVARRRFKADRKAGLPATAHGFRAWARKTYNAAGATGKLRELVSA